MIYLLFTFIYSWFIEPYGGEGEDSGRKIQMTKDVHFSISAEQLTSLRYVRIYDENIWSFILFETVSSWIPVSS